MHEWFGGTICINHLNIQKPLILSFTSRTYIVDNQYSLETNTLLNYKKNLIWWFNVNFAAEVKDRVCAKCYTTK